MLCLAEKHGRRITQILKHCDGMPAKGTTKLNWMQHQLSSGPAVLNAKINKEINVNKEAPCGGVGKQDF